MSRRLGRHEVQKGEEVTISHIRCTINPNNYDIDEVTLSNFCENLIYNIKHFLVVYKNRSRRPEIDVNECLDREPECIYTIEYGKIHQKIHIHINVRMICLSSVGCMHVNKDKVKRFADQQLGKGNYVHCNLIEESNKAENYLRK